jgi:hypothetical protein
VSKSGNWSQGEQLELKPEAEVETEIKPEHSHRPHHQTTMVMMMA